MNEKELLNKLEEEIKLENKTSVCINKDGVCEEDNCRC